MAPTPIYFCIDVEPDEFSPALPGFSVDNVSEAFRRIKARRARMEDATGAKVNFGWNVRLDRLIETKGGDAAAIVKLCEDEFAEVIDQGDHIGLHIHVFEQMNEKDKWRANYAERTLIEDTIDFSIATYNQTFGKKPRSVRMGDMWLGQCVIDRLEEAGVEYEVSLEPCMRPSFLEGSYPGTNSRGLRPSTMSAEFLPYHPDKKNYLKPATGEGAANIWMVPNSVFPRMDWQSPGYWIMTAFIAIMTGGRRWRPRDVIRPQTVYTQEKMRTVLHRELVVSEMPKLCSAVRNYTPPDRLDTFLDMICDLAPKRPMSFVTLPDYVKMLAPSADAATVPDALSSAIAVP